VRATGIVRRALVLAGLAVAGIAHGQESGKVVAVVDGDTLKVARDGGTLTVRLIGVDTPERGDERRPVEELAEAAAELTRRLALGRLVQLEPDRQAGEHDAYGRTLRYVHLPDGSLLNAEIIARGYGQAYTRFPFERIEEFRSLERSARQAGRGLWQPDGRPTIDAGRADAHVGEVVEVCGTVASTRYMARADGRPTYLNLERPHPRQSLTVVIWGADRAAFGTPEERYAGRRICVTGKVRGSGRKPEIFASDPSQIVLPAAPR
jgi:micrococcal nuclease